MESASSQTDVRASRADIRRENAPARTVGVTDDIGSRDVRLGLGVMGSCALAAIVVAILTQIT
jgi:hypothetical protein